jgi:hypothetical protein
MARKKSTPSTPLKAGRQPPYRYGEAVSMRRRSWRSPEGFPRRSGFFLPRDNSSLQRKFCSRQIPLQLVLPKSKKTKERQYAR